MIDTIIKGGPVMIPIIILALLSLGIILERFLYLYITDIDYDRFRDDFIKKLEETGNDLKKMNADRKFPAGIPERDDSKGWIRKLPTLIRAEREKRNPYHKIVSSYLACLDSGERSREETLKRIGSEEIERMERNFKGLSAVSHISPLLGLLGTVTGIISAFAVISELGGQVDVTALAGGIWEAMITTAAGLIVAIPSQLAFLYFEKRVDARANRMSYLITYLNERLFNTGPCNNSARHDSSHKEDSLLIRHALSGESI